MHGDSVFISAEMPISELFFNFDLNIDDLHEFLQQRATRTLKQLGVANITPWIEAIDVYVKNLETERRLSATSIGTYVKIMTWFREYATLHLRGEGCLGEAFLSCLESFVFDMRSEKDLADATVNKYIAVMHHFAHFLYDHYVEEKPVLPDFLRVNQLLPQTLNRKEITQLLDIARRSNFGVRNHCLVSFMLSTGLRRNECRLVQLRDIIDFRSVHVRHGKGGRTRLVPLPKHLSEELREYVAVCGIRNQSDYLFGNTKKPWKPVSNSSMDEVFLRMMRKMPTYQSGDPIKGFHLHTLRHTYARFLQANGVALRHISTLLGHASMRSTEIYTALDSESLREVAGPALDHLGALIAGDRR